MAGARQRPPLLVHMAAQLIEEVNCVVSERLHSLRAWYECTAKNSSFSLRPEPDLKHSIIISINMKGW